MLSVLFQHNFFMYKYLKAVQSGMLFKANHMLNGEDIEYFFVERIVNALSMYYKELCPSLNLMMAK